MSSVNLKQFVYNAIMDEIYSMKLHPGDVLNEKALVERFGCSKSPVREALLTLCNEGVLKSIPRYGYEIIRLTPQDIRKMMEMRMVLETGFLGRYFRYFTDEQIDELEEINKNCMDETLDMMTHWKFNMDFHIRMMSFCENDYATDALKRCLSYQTRAYVQSYWGKGERTDFTLDTRNHEKIIKALREKDFEKLMESIVLDYQDFGGVGSFSIQ